MSALWAAGVTRLKLSRVGRGWQAMGGTWRHFCINLLIGLSIEAALHLAHHWHLPVLEPMQNSAMDTMTRLHSSSCAAAMSPVTQASGLQPLGEMLASQLRCAGTDQAPTAAVLVEIDASVWRSERWAGGEPVRAPREPLLQLVRRSFELGAQQVVLDVMIEDPLLRPGSTAPWAGWAQAEDQAFAEGLRQLLQSPALAEGTGRQLVLVRSTRAPLPEHGPAHLAELRRSQALDEVVAASGGRVVLAAPYFRVDADRLTREWDLFKVVCERQAPGQPGLLRVVPSVQLLTTTHALGVSSELVSPPAGQPLAGAPLAHRQCVPFPLDDEAGWLSEAQSAQALANLRRALDGEPLGEHGDAFACPPNHTESVASPLGLRRAYWCSLKGTLATTAPNVQWADLPGPGDLSNRMIFRLAEGQVPRLSAALMLGESSSDLAALREMLNGRIVVIGQTFAEAVDQFYTPLGDMPGAMVLVNAIDSMRTYGLLAPADSGLSLGLVFGLLLVVSYLFARWDSVTGTLLASLFVLGVFGVMSFFSFGKGVWLDFALPLLGIQLHRIEASWSERRALKRLRALHPDSH